MFYIIKKTFKRSFFVVDRIINKIKAFVWVLGGIFTIIVFLQQLITLNPRVTNLESRMVNVEGKTSAIEIKLDSVLTQTSETNRDVKDIYHLILERHK